MSISPNSHPYSGASKCPDAQGRRSALPRHVRQVPAPRPFDQYLGPVGARAGLYRVASFGFEPFPVAGRVGVA